MTLSIVARCSKTSRLGILTTSSSICVGSRCTWASAGIGVVATQNYTNLGLGSLGLDLLARLGDPKVVLRMLIESDASIGYRQLILMSADGSVAIHNGNHCLPDYSSFSGFGVAAAGNLLKDKAIPSIMVKRFLDAEGQSLELRLLAAADAGLAAGGETKPLMSCGLKVVDKYPWPVTDLRVDYQLAPLTELRRIWTLYEEQQQRYMDRALGRNLPPC